MDQKTCSDLKRLWESNLIKSTNKLESCPISWSRSAGKDCLFTGSPVQASYANKARCILLGTEDYENIINKEHFQHAQDFHPSTHLYSRIRAYGVALSRCYLDEYVIWSFQRLLTMTCAGLTEAKTNLISRHAHPPRNTHFK